MSNKGFSLVELIIVIAIMAILIGVLAPAFLKYVEKSRISSDLNLVDNISKALTYAATDGKIAEDSDTTSIIADMEDLDNPMKLEDLMNHSTSLFTKEVLDTLGWADCNQATYLKFIKSAHDANSEIYISHSSTLQAPFFVWISNTDRTGGRDLENATKASDVDKCIAVSRKD